MNDSYIISKMNEYMFQLNQKMGKWLDKSLPRLQITGGRSLY